MGAQRAPQRFQWPEHSPEKDAARRFVAFVLRPYHLPPRLSCKRLCAGLETPTYG